MKKTDDDRGYIVHGHVLVFQCFQCRNIFARDAGKAFVDELRHEEDIIRSRIRTPMMIHMYCDECVGKKSKRRT